MNTENESWADLSTWSGRILYLIVLSIVVCAILFKPYMQMKAYNRHCKDQISMWDAMWIELRIGQCESKSK